MINPLFFPHSCLSDRERDVILSFFDRVSVFRSLPSRAPLPGVVGIVPAGGGESQLTSFLNEYRNFAALNMDKASAFLTGANTKPLFDSTWAAELRSEIIRCMEDHTETSAENQDHAQELLWARAFIEIAHEYDEKNRDIDIELDQLENREKQLFDALMGGDTDDLEDLSVVMRERDRDSSEIRIKHRLKAWASLFVSAWPDAEKTGDGFYLTHSRSVIQELEEFIPVFQLAGYASLDTLNPEDFDAMIRKWISQPYPVTGVKVKDPGKSNGLTLYIAPDLSPCDVFSRVLKKGSCTPVQRPEIKNTVIGLIHP